MKTAMMEKTIGNHYRTEAVVLAVLVGLLVFVLPTYSQTVPLFTLSILPDVAIAGDRVTITVIALNFTASSTDFRWFRDGEELKALSGPGRDTLSFLTDPTRSGITQIKMIIAPGPEFENIERVFDIYALPNLEQQTQEILEGQSDFTLEASETSPTPGQTVTVRVKTFSFDKALANFQWFINGRPDSNSSGRGRFEISFDAGKEGQTKTVSVTVSPPQGGSRSKQITIRPATAAFYWWADTVTPYWYRGKALPSLNSRVTVMAVPSSGFSASDLSFRWEFNGSAITQSSGFGKSTFSFNFAFPVRESVGVSMQNFSGSFSKTASIDIEPRSPEVSIYEVRPLRGVVFERRLKEFSAASGDAYDFLAAPFFFPKERRAGLGYLWTVNGQAITGKFANPWLLTLKPNPGEASSNQIGIEVNDSVRGGERISSFLRADFR